MIRNIVLLLLGVAVAMTLWAWLSAPKPLTAWEDGLAAWKAAPERQQVATAAYYVRFWEKQGQDVEGITAGDLRRCIDEHLSAEGNIQTAAGACVMKHLRSSN